MFLSAVDRVVRSVKRVPYQIQQKSPRYVPLHASPIEFKSSIQSNQRKEKFLLAVDMVVTKSHKRNSVQPNELHAFAYSVLCVYLSALLDLLENDFN